jgi:glycosyltransferase involved in cell wall biosynthesis
MSASPNVSVIVATYNQAQFLGQALDAILMQTLSPDEFEVIVINDGSTDSTSEILRRYTTKITCLEQSNQGLAKSCNIGLEQARGKYMVRIDSDDVVDRDLLYIEKRILDENPDACCVYSDRYEVHDGEKRKVKVGTDNVYDLIASGTMFRTQTVRAVGSYRPFYWEEYDLYLRLMEKGRFLHIPIPLYSYRKHGQSTTNKEEERLRGWVELAEEWGIQKLRAAGSNPELDKAIEEKTVVR